MYLNQKIAVFELMLAIITIAGALDTQELIENLEIIYDKTIKSKFPIEFHLKVDSLKKRSLQFEKIAKDKDYPLASSNIYTINSASRVVKFDQDSDNSTDFELYKEINGTSYATLMKTQGVQTFQMV